MGAKSIEQTYSREGLLASKWPTYDNLRVVAASALNYWLTSQPPEFNTPILEFNKFVNQQDLDERTRNAAQKAWRVRVLWLPQLEKPHENFPRQEFIINSKNKHAVLFMLKMFEGKEDDLVVRRFNLWAETQGIKLPLDYKDLDLPEGFITQISKRKDLQRIIAAKKRTEKAKAEVK